MVDKPTSSQNCLPHELNEYAPKKYEEIIQTKSIRLVDKMSAIQLPCYFEVILIIEYFLFDIVLQFLFTVDCICS